MKFAFRHFAAICVLVLSTAPGFAQVNPKRAEPPGRMLTLPGRSPQPNASPYQPPSVTNLSQVIPPALRTQARPFNLDTAVARILADLKLIGVVGEFELAVTNAGKVELTVFPLLVHVLDGQVRTEMDISAASAAITATGPFSALRQVGLTRVINLTQVKSNVRLTSQIFPEGKCYITRELPAEEMLMLIRAEKKPLGQETLAGVACEKSLFTLVYPTGEKREGRIWSAAGGLRQIQFDVGDSRLTVRVQESQGIAELRAQDIAEQKLALFELPKGYEKFADLDAVLTRIFALQQRSLR